MNLDKLSLEELENLLKEKEDERDYYDLRQLTAKTIINSVDL